MSRMSTERNIPLRSLRERAIQTLAYEAGSLLISVPMYQWLFGASTVESVRLLVTLSASVLLWSPVHNTVFDWLDARWFDRVASDRCGVSRCVHALSYELSTLIVTVPLIVWMSGSSWFDALLLDLGLTLLYTVYAWIFYWCFDRLRPVSTISSPPHRKSAPSATTAIGPFRHLKRLPNR